MRTRLRSRELIEKEDILREERKENVHDIDLLLDATIRRAEEGLRRIEELEEEFFSSPKWSRKKRFQSSLSEYSETSRREEFSFEEDKLLDLLSCPLRMQTTYTCRAEIRQKHKNSDIDSLCDASFQSGGSSDDALSLKLPELTAPIPARKAIHCKGLYRSNSEKSSFKVSANNSSTSMSSFTDSAVGLDCSLSPLDTRKEVSMLQRKNSGLHRQISDMQLEMSQLQVDIKDARKTITSNYRKTNPPEVTRRRDEPPRVSFRLKRNVDPVLARQSLQQLQFELQNLIFSGQMPL